MRINEIIVEAFSLESTMAAVTADIGNNVTATFDELKKSASNWYGNRGDLDGWGFAAAGVEARVWWDRVWLPRTDPRRTGSQRSSGLQGELYDLSRQAGPSGAALGMLLHSMIKNRGNFVGLGRNLIPVLRTIADAHRNPTLAARLDQWQRELNEYDRWLFGMQDGEPVSVTKAASGAVVATTPRQVSAPRPPSAIPGQNVAAEKVISDVLRSLPPGVAGDIRQAIARSSNKIMSLQAELRKRGITD